MDVSNIQVIGLDGGGTKVEAVLMDSAGTILAQGLGGSNNVSFVPKETVLQSIRDAVSFLEPGAEFDIRNIFAVGGVLISGMECAEEILGKMGFTGHYYRFSEYDIAFRRAGLSEQVGIAVIAGTGSTYRAVNASGEAIHLGGWGMVVGDDGSAFDIGLRTIKAIGRSIDGRGPKTQLVGLVLQETGAKHFGHLLRMYCRPQFKQREIAGLAKLTSKAASSGDETARSILGETGRILAADVLFLAGKLFHKDKPFDIALSGGVFNSGDLVVKPFEELVKPEYPLARIHLPKIGAGEAAARLSLEKALSQDQDRR